MKTFTTYAEKKAKQFLNLLQECTKGIRITAILILLLMGVSNASAAVTVYFENTVNWDNVYVYFYSGPYWDNSKGSGSNNIKSGPHQMTYDTKLGLHKYTYNGTHSGYIAFTKDSQSSYDNFWQTAAVYRSDFNSSKPVFVPSTTSSGSYNSTTYYSNGSWDTFVKGVTYTVTVPTGTTSCYIIGSWDWNNFTQMNQDPNDANKFTITYPDQTKYHAYKYACAPSWGFQELNSNCNGTINDRTYSANDVVECWSKKTIYVKVDHSDWKKNNERFAIYWWDNDSHNGWVDLEEIACNNYYKADIPLYGTSFSIVRMNGATSANNWDNKWNQTVDLNWTAAGNNNLYTVNGKESEKYKGSWSSSLLTISTNATAGGNITVSPGETVNIGETITVTLNAQSGFVKGNATIKIGNNSAETLVEGQAYTICGATTIDAEFIPSTPTPVYLKTTNWNADNAWFAIYWWKSAGNDGWVKMNPVDCNGDYYYGEVPAGTTHFIFVRLKPNTESGYKSSNNGLNWDNKWNQTGNLGLPNADANLFTPNATEGATATWSAYVAPTYSITINAGTGGNVYVSNSSNIALNEQVTVTISTSEGYTYKSGTIAIGTNETTNIIEGSSNHTICGPTTITAQWTAIKYTVTLDNQGATTAGTASVQATYGSAMPEATMPTRTGYTFGGYYTAADGGGTQYYKADGTSANNWDIASETTLYAKWTANTYTITWDANGGIVDPATSTYIYDGDPVNLPTPTRTGCTFNGWFTESTGGTKITEIGTTNKPTSDVTYYAQWTIPVPTTDYTATRVYEEETINGWIADGDGAQATPYKFYNDETVRLTVTPLTEVAGLTAYYKVGETEQTTNTFDLTTITTEITPITITTYYKNNGVITGEQATTTIYFQQVLTPEMVLLTTPGDEISLEKVKQGTNVEVSYSATYNGYTGNVTIKANETTLIITSDVKYATEYTPAEQVGILTFTATTEEVAGRVFEVRTEVAVYKLVTIKVNDPNSILSNVYMWRGDDFAASDVKTEWPGESFAQHFGTWRVFVVKYPYYDHFIVNGGSDANQTFNYEIPSENTCYQLSDNKVNQNGYNNYKLTNADCPGDLAVSNIDNITLTKGEQKIVSPSIQVSLGNKLSDVTATVSSANTTVATAIMSGTNIIVYGHEVGSTTITVKYTLHEETVTKTFQVTVEKDTHITIQVKVPDENGPSNARIGWKDQNKIYVRYWLKNTTGGDEGSGDILMTYLITQNDHLYLEASVPLGSNGKANFHFYFSESMDDWKNNDWRRSRNEENISEDGCYRVYNDNDGDRGLVREGYYCFEDEYQIKIEMQNGKEYSSNVVTSTSDILSFFAPGKDEVNYRSGVVMLYKNGNLHTTIDPVTFPESNVYTAKLNADGTGLTNVAVYSGNFYIRTWGTNGDIDNKGWHSVKDWDDTQKKSRTFTEFVSREGEFYNHYWVQDMNTGGYEGKDVSACVANEYNDDLAGKLLQDKHTNEYGDIKVGTDKVINVRFGYDPRTNYFGRAILQGSQYDTYLNIHCDNAYYDKDCTKKFPYGTSNRDNKMYDISTWVYQRDFYVPITNNKPSASLYIEATSPNNTKTVIDHLLGYVTNEITGEATSIPIQKTVIGSGTTNGTYLIRVIYDFKTNRIITAWLPQGTVEVNSEKTLNADVLFVRKENEEVPQIQLSSTGKIKSLESMFFAMELQRGDADRNNRHQEQYWFTLPFDCVVGSISGVPGYMQIWGIQRYNGKKRAENGWFNPSTTFWEWLTPDDVMHAGEGYLLVFDKKNAPFEEIEVDKMDAEGNIIDGQKEIISMMRLYFPSIKSGFDMQQQSEAQLKRTYENHTCTITASNRYLQDSNWKVIGTTSYNNAGITGYTKDDNPKYDELSEAPSFRYKYEYTMSNDNTSFWYRYTPENGQTATYQSFFGYMVQFAGTINWQPIMSETVPEQIAARRYVPANERTSYTTRLELANAAGEVQDLTFVALDEKATIGFDQNKDLNKVKNRGTNIYTFVEGLPFAGNTLPKEKATVPVGVRVDAAGEYTFRMPDGTDGIAVTLVDNVTGTHTNMLMNEYTVTLNAGTIENRFYLVVDPDRTATSVENVGSGANGDEAKDVEKFLIDGKLFIRTTDGIFDAKGQRL